LAKNELLSVQEKAAARIKKAETLTKLANIVALKTGKELAEKEQLITKLSEEKEKAERENQGLLTTIEQNTKAMYLMRQDFDEFKTKFADKHNEVISLKEDMRRLESHLAHSQEGLKNWHQQTVHLQQKVENLSADLKKYKGRVKELKDSLDKEKEVSRLAQEELQKKYEGLLQNAKAEELDKLKLQHDEEVKELSKKFVALTQELESVQRKRDEVFVLYEEAEAREKEALLKLNELQQKFNEEFLNFSAISPNVSVNNSPLDKSFLGDIKQSLGEMENKLIHNQSIQVNPDSLNKGRNQINPFSGQFPINFGGMNQTVHSNLMNEEIEMKPFKKLEDMTVYESEYGYDDSKGFHPFDNSKSFAESKLINQSVLKENSQIKEQIKKESEDMIDLSSLHIQDKSKAKSESESFEIVDKSVSLEDPNKKK
jgi:DNA repair exonuclease SbcCD ATPase subunit